MGEIRDQGRYGSCYAYSAADLMSYGINKRNKYDQISALGVAIKFGLKYDSEKLLDSSDSNLNEAGGMLGGGIADAINAANEFGACKEAFVPSWDMSDRPNSKKPDSSIELKYQELIALWRKRQGHTPDECTTSLKSAISNSNMKSLDQLSIEANFQLVLEQLRPQLIQYHQKKFRIAKEAEYKKVKPEITTSELNALIEPQIIEFTHRFNETLKKKGAAALCERSLSSMLNQLFSCESEMEEFPNWKSKSEKIHDVVKDKKDDSFKAKFNQYMNEAAEKKLPVGITYDMSGMIKHPKRNREMLHASIIVGRLMVDGKCQYIVRNSWGTDWPINDDGVDELAGLGAKKLQIGKFTIKGHFMVSEELLMSKLRKFTHVPLEH